MIWPIRKQVRPSRPEMVPSIHMIIGKTKTVNSAIRTAIGAALASASPLNSRSIPSMKKKRMMPKTCRIDRRGKDNCCAHKGLVETLNEP